MRNVLLNTLDPDIIRKLEADEEVFINLLATGGYEFAVAFLALMAVGAAVSPLSPDWPVKEAANLVQRGGAVSVLATERCAQKGAELAKLVSSNFEPLYRCINIKPHVMQPCLAPEDIHISSDLYLDINGSGLIIFTSGTTGPPKGAIRRRGFFTDGCLMTADQYGMQEGDTVLHQLPVHHITGIGFTLIPFLMMGGCIEFRTGGFDTAFTWERIRQGGLTYFSGVPTIYMRLMQYYELNIINLPFKEQKPYLDGILGFKSLLCGTSALPAPLQEKWAKLRGGQKILTRYGGTEFGSGFVVPPDAENVPPTSVGAVTPGVDLKLSNGDEGEILMKSPYMFSRYASDPEATKAAHDENGYFKTGDIARRVGRWYFIMGRASIDSESDGLAIATKLTFLSHQIRGIQDIGIGRGTRNYGP
jgi:malonyl-CoA/methylmalonyl-CoA synthetase